MKDYNTLDYAYYDGSAINVGSQFNNVLDSVRVKLARLDTLQLQHEHVQSSLPCFRTCIHEDFVSAHIYGNVMRITTYRLDATRTNACLDHSVAAPPPDLFHSFSFSLELPAVVRIVVSYNIVSSLRSFIGVNFGTPEGVA